jgi:hypothetical protein
MKFTVFGVTGGDRFWGPTDISILGQGLVGLYLHRF